MVKKGDRWIGEGKTLKEIKRPHIIFNFKYPKFFLLVLAFIVAYILFMGRNVSYANELILNIGYLGTFLAGTLFSYGFTTPIAIALFLILAKSQNIWIAGFIGGFGALCSDLLIFHFIRHSFQDEIQKFEREKLVKWVDHKIPEKIRHYIIVFLAGIIIASPLPDEIGVTMLSVHNQVSIKLFTLLSYTFNTTGIFLLLLLGLAI